MDFEGFQFLLVLFSFFYYVSNMTVLIGLVLISFSERCKPITRGVYPPSFQGQLISFHLGVFDLLLQQETKKKGKHDCNEKEKTPL